MSARMYKDRGAAEPPMCSYQDGKSGKEKPYFVLSKLARIISVCTTAVSSRVKPSSSVIKLRGLQLYAEHMGLSCTCWLMASI